MTTIPTMVSVLAATREILSNILDTEPLSTNSLATRLSEQFGVSRKEIYPFLSKIAPSYGLAIRDHPVTSTVYGKEAVVRPWLWVSKARWTEVETPEPAILLSERVAILEDFVCVLLNALEVEEVLEVSGLMECLEIQIERRNQKLP